MICRLYVHIGNFFLNPHPLYPRSERSAPLHPEKIHACTRNVAYFWLNKINVFEWFPFLPPKAGSPGSSQGNFIFEISKHI